MGPFSHLRDGTVLEDGAEVGAFVEVSQSRLETGARARHLAYLGNAEVGADVNIGAGTITANYDGVNKHATEIGRESQPGRWFDLGRAGKGGRRGAIVGAGAVVTRGQDVPAGQTVVGVPARAATERKGPRESS